jgi:hypothetical protein
VEADFPAVDDFLIPAAVLNASLKVSLADDGAGKAGGLSLSAEDFLANEDVDYNLSRIH